MTDDMTPPVSDDDADDTAAVEPEAAEGTEAPEVAPEAPAAEPEADADEEPGFGAPVAPAAPAEGGENAEEVPGEEE